MFAERNSNRVNLINSFINRNSLHCSTGKVCSVVIPGCRYWLMASSTYTNKSLDYFDIILSDISKSNFIKITTSSRLNSRLRKPFGRKHLKEFHVWTNKKK